MRTLLAALLLAAPAAAAPPQFSADRIKADVTFLADDLLEGRGTGERGHEIAAKYVAAQFAVAGLKPGAKDGSWFQRVTLQERRLDGPASVTVSGAGGKRTWANGTAVIVAPSTTEAKTDVEAPVVFVGFGLDAPAQGFDDYAGLDVRGKIVAWLDGIPKGPPNETWAHLARTKAKAAAARGAIGSVVVATISARQRQPWGRSQAYATVPRMTWVGADGKAFVDAPGIRASATLDTEPAAALFAGGKVPLADVLAEADREGGRPKGFALPGRVRISAATAFRTLDTPEVIGVLPGSDPKLKAEHVVLMAHVDHLGIRPDNAGDKIYNGALDNAAGTAVMIEVARAFAAGPAPKRSVMFVANTAEEKGLLGAESFANDPSVPIEDIVSVVDLDQPMLLYDFTDVVAFGADHSTLGESVRAGAARAGVALSPDPFPEETVFVRSDHYTFVKRGVPAIMMATGWANGGEAAWKDFLANRYHQPGDDLTQKIDWAAGAKYGRVNYEIARTLADAPTRPRWYAGDYFGDTFAPGAPKVPRR